jgi:enoyl-CoA hydratase
MSLIQGELHDGTLVLTLNRPAQLNALNRDVLTSLDDWIERIVADPAVRVVVITGSGERAFCAGADIEGFLDLGADGAYELMRYGQGVFDRLERLPQPVIAAVNGYALGGGCELALACDLRFAAEHARFGQPEITLANLPGWGGTQRLPRLVGPARAKHLIFTGAYADAREALAIGLADAVHPGPQLLDATLHYAAGLVAKAPLALALAKESVRVGLEQGLQTGLDFEARAVGRCFTTPEQSAAVQEFLANRAARARATE